MTESQIDRIRMAEKAFREVVKLTAQIRYEAVKLPAEDAALHQELLDRLKIRTTEDSND